MKESNGIFTVILGLHSTQLHKRDHLQEVPNQSSILLQMCNHKREYHGRGLILFPQLCIILQVRFAPDPFIFLSLSLVRPQALYSGHGLSKTVVPPADLHAVTRVSHSHHPLLLGLVFYCVHSSQRTKCAFILISKSTFLRFCLNVISPLRYLQVEWEVRKGTARTFTSESINGSLCRVPLQDNSSDCGLYLLQYVESFLQVPTVHTGLIAKLALF